MEMDTIILQILDPLIYMFTIWTCHCTHTLQKKLWTPPITTTEVASNSFRVNGSENTLPFVFGVAGDPLSHATQVP